MAMNYEKIWNQLKKHIVAVDRRLYSKDEILNMMHGFEGQEFKREKTRQRQEIINNRR